ncbi:MAG TPA: bifunctional enoyl-CoA hydratase/phosphate acetyltransferase [Magnetospirillum sp.]|jgi:phosphate acetyltransferase/phosphate butyryltransferase|nr:bifunctional enoyl-CoA hydratase/phosphate acetyltransferase [Magnetospirillum sp.]
MATINGRTFDQISVGDSATLSRTLTMADIELFAVMSGDLNPWHLDEAAARSCGFERIAGHSQWGAALLSSLIGTRLPGPGSRYVKQDLQFHKPVYIGDTVRASVSVREKRGAERTIVLECRCVDDRGDVVLDGTATVTASAQPLSLEVKEAPEVHFHRHERFNSLITRTRPLEPITCAVAWPCNGDALLGPLAAARENIIVPILVGAEATIRAAAEQQGESLDGCRIEDCRDPVSAAIRCVELAREGQAESLMKGSLHTDELMSAVVSKTGGIRTARRISHVFAMDVPAYDRALFITDAAINIVPTLADKRDIIQNVIDLVRALGLAQPRVAILSAVETINEKLPSTIEAAALCKMADRGQITGALIDGPLAFDNAISMQAAQIKKIVSPVAGQADVLLVPDLESGNMLVKQLSYFAGADGGGIVLGARVPIILTSRADSVRARVASAAIAQLFVHARRTAAPQVAEA